MVSGDLISSRDIPFIFAIRMSQNEYRFVCSRYRSEECPRISHRSVENAYQVTFWSPQDGSDTLDIVEGTKAKVECLEGYTVSGDMAVCEKGKWSQLPTCYAA